MENTSELLITVQNKLFGFVSFFNDLLWSNVLIFCLIGIGIWFTLRTGFVQLRLFPEMLRLLTEPPEEQQGKKSISSFQAFCVSTASRVGVGNIAGVALAIATGGPGAIFWMWLIAFLGSATCFAECTLGQIYKVPLAGINAGDPAHREFHGGPAYYIQNALNCKWAAKLFAALLAVTFGLVYVSVQANTMVLSLGDAFRLPKIFACSGIVLLSGLVIFGGMKRIARVAEWMVPIMAGLYLLVALIVAVIHYREVPGMFASIFREAFNLKPMLGGTLGSVMLLGIKRGLFSNEAGEGSIPNAAATAHVSHPVKQGLIQGFGVFLDTWVVCTATAFIVLLGGIWRNAGNSLQGIELAQRSLGNTFGTGAPQLLSVMVLFFAFSSIVGNYYYAEVNIAFFKGNVKRNLFFFRALLLGMIIWGSFAKLGLIWDSADLFMGLLCLVNLTALIRLSPQVMAALKDYQIRRKTDPSVSSFSAKVLPSQHGIYAWQDKDA